jgi:hypothetical protein
MQPGRFFFWSRAGREFLYRSTSVMELARANSVEGSVGSPQIFGEQIRALRATATRSRDGSKERSHTWEVCLGDERVSGVSRLLPERGQGIDPDWKDHGRKWRRFG